MNKIQSVIDQAHLIIADRHDVADSTDQFKLLKTDLYRAIGVDEEELPWCDLIESDTIPWEFRRILCELDDCLDLHNTTRYVL
jgi:hypothetical protein